MVDLIPTLYLIFISSFLLAIFLIDNIVTFTIMFNIRSLTKTIRKDYTEEITKKVRKILVKQAEQSFITRHLLKAFPSIKFFGSGVKKKTIHRFFQTKKRQKNKK